MKQLLYATLFSFFFAGVLIAQAPTTGELAGIVTTEEQIPIDGARIYIIGPQGDQSTTTASDGSYVFRLLPVGTYTVVATADGYLDRTFEGIEVRLNDRTRSEIILLRGLKEEITVRAPAIDVTQSSVNIQIPSTILERVPVGRSVGEVALLSASATPNQGATGASPGKHNPSISGSTGLENAYIIDGVNVGDTGFGGLGAYSFRHASFGSGVTFNFIETIEIMSSGFGVEYANSTGGVINVLTKSGTNELHGSVFSYMTPDALRGEYQQPLLENRSVHALNGITEWDAGFQIGGPIIKDQLFFFAAYNPQKRTIRKIPDPATELAILGEREIDEFRNAYSSKISWNLGENHDLVFSLFGDPGDASLGPQMAHPHNFNENPNYESELKFGSNSQVLRYNGILTPSWILEAQAGRSSTHYEEDLPPRWDQHFFIDTIEGFGSQGGPGYYDKRDGENLQLQVKSTSFFEALGNHTIKIGTSLDNVDYLGTNLYSGPSGVQFSDASGNQYTYDSGLAVFKICPDASCSQIYRVVQGFLNNTPNDTESQIFSLFVEDSWQPRARLSLTFGLRADRQEIHGGGSPKILPDGSEVRFRSHTFELWDHLSPRVGFSWDFTKQARGQIYMNYGRFHRRLDSEFANRILSPSLQFLGVDYVVQPGLSLNDNLAPQFQTFAFGEPFTSVTGLEIISGTKLPYQDEFTMGAQYELSSGLVVGARYINRRLGRIIEDFGDAPAETILAGTAAGRNFIAGNAGKNLNHLCPPEHPDCWTDPVRKYDALEINAEKRFSDRWQLLTSYRLSHLRGNYEGLFNSATGLPGHATTQFDFPNNTDFTDEELSILCGETPFGVCRNSLPPPMKEQSQIRDLPTDRRHVFQAVASYVLSPDINLGANLRILSGLPQTRYRASAVYGWPGDIPAGTDRRTPWTWTLDFHGDYTFSFTQSVQGVVTFDVFNMTSNETAIAYDLFLEHFGGPNSDFEKVVLFQEPRAVRLGFQVRF